MSNELLAALLGAIVAGAIAWALLLVQLRAQQNAMAEESLKKKKALSRSLVIKIMRIDSDLHTLANHFEEGANQTTDSQLWTAVFPLAPLHSPVEFNNEELSLLLDLGGSEQFNELINLDKNHHAYIALADSYSRQRMELGELLAESNIQRSGHQMVFSQDDMNRFEPRMIVLNDIVQEFLEKGRADQKRCSELLFRTNDLINNELGTGLKIEKVRERRT